MIRRKHNCFLCLFQFDGRALYLAWIAFVQSKVMDQKNPNLYTILNILYFYNIIYSRNSKGMVCIRHLRESCQDRVIGKLLSGKPVHPFVHVSYLRSFHVAATFVPMHESTVDTYAWARNGKSTPHLPITMPTSSRRSQHGTNSANSTNPDLFLCSSTSPILGGDYIVWRWNLDLTLYMPWQPRGSPSTCMVVISVICPRIT